MTKDEVERMEKKIDRNKIIRMAIQCQLVNTSNREGIYMDSLEEFAKLVLKEALTQPAPVQEPVAWNAGVPPLYPEMKDGETISVEYTTPPAASVQEPVTTLFGSLPVYDTPPVQEPNQSPYPEYDRGFSNGWDRGFAAAQRQWVGLTDADIAETDWHLSADREYEQWTLQEQLVVCGVKDFARAIEAKLKEKNK